MTGHVIDFKPDGSVEAMHNDKFDLSFLGKQSIQRATEIVFNELTQSWSIRVPNQFRWFTPILNPNGLGVFEASIGFSTYEEARSAEVEWLNECRLQDIDPVCTAGLEILRNTRIKRTPK